MPVNIFSNLVLDNNISNSFESFSIENPRKKRFEEIKIVKIKISTIPIWLRILFSEICLLILTILDETTYSELIS